MAQRTVTTLSLEMSGMEALKRALRETPDAVRDELRQAVSLSTFAMAQRMRAMVPVDTGTLKGSIASSVKDASGRITISGDGYYWRFLEYGRRGRAASPFIRPAGEEESAAFEQRVLNIGRSMERFWARVA